MAGKKWSKPDAPHHQSPKSAQPQDSTAPPGNLPGNRPPEKLTTAPNVPPVPSQGDNVHYCHYDCTPRWKKYLEIGLFAVGIFYTFFAGAQWLTMRDALNLDQRPWVGIAANGNFRLQLAEGLPLEADGIAQNVGRSPAINVVTVNKMETVGQSGHDPIFPGYSKSEAGTRSVLFPGSVTALTIDTRKPSAEGNAFPHLSGPDVNAFKTGTVKIYVYGSIWYNDVLHGGEHRTDYCFTYNPETSTPTVSSFLACKTHNYAD